MVDREQDNLRAGEAEGRPDPSGGVEAVVLVSAPLEQETEAARRARFLTALDKVMSDHRDVLAALAK